MTISKDEPRVQLGDHLAALLPTYSTPASPTPKDVSVDEAVIRQFYETVFKHCTSDGAIALKWAEHRKGGLSKTPKWVRMGSEAPRHAAEVAAATAAKVEPAVFCPPLCLFGDERGPDGATTAKESNIVEAPVLSIELDKEPEAGFEAVCEVIGLPTVYVRSGGICEKTGEDRLHAHWRLAVPARGPEAIAKLKTARALATAIAKGDATGVNPVHPLRWPGSVHRKDPSRPRVATADFLDAITLDIDLDEALAKLQAAAEAQGVSVAASLPRSPKTAPVVDPLDGSLLRSLAEAIPNPDKPDWERWNRIGMAFHAVSGGSDEGRDAFMAWSEKAESVFDADAVDARWDHWDRSPAEFMTVETLVAEAEKHSPGFRERFTVQRWFDPGAAAAAAAKEKSTAEAAASRQTDTSNWPEPADIFDFGEGLVTREPPPGALPRILEDFSRDTARRMGASVAQFAGGTLAALSGAVGTKFRIQPRDHDTSWTEPGVIWVMDVQPPGGMKTPVLRAVTQPFESLEAGWVEQDAPLRRAWRAQEKRRPKAGEPTMSEPPQRRCIVKDATIEGLADILRHNRSLLYVSDELAAIIGGAGQYKQGKGNDRQKLLTLYNCDAVTIDRKTSEAIHVPVWGATIYGGIQPGKLREIIASIGGDGFLQRFLVIHGDGTRRKGVDEEPGASTDQYRNLIREIAAVREVAAAPVKLSPEARAVWEPHAERWDALYDMRNASEAFQEHLSKMSGTAYRLLLLCHIANEWVPSGGRPETRSVSAETAQQAARLVNWFLTQSIHFYEDYVGDGEAIKDARSLADHLLVTGKTRLTRREIGRVRNAMEDKPWRMCAAMRQLAWANWVEVDPKGGSDKHGPEWWTVNPRIHAAFADRAPIAAAKSADTLKRIRAAGEAKKKLLQNG